MLAIDGFHGIFVIVLLAVVSFDCFNAHGRDCYEVGSKMVCYFKPSERYIEMTWDDAWKVCKENNSTLPVIENRLTEETLRRHREKSKSSFPTEMWLAGRDTRTNVWQWLNGRPFDQQNFLRESDVPNKLYVTNAVITGRLKYLMSYARDKKYYICYYNGSELCQNVRIISWKNGCIYVNNDEELNLVDARNRCLDGGGDLATFEEDEDLHMLKQKNSSLLNEQRKYWIGLRLNWWMWNETDSSKEMKYSNWTIYENRPNQECLCIRFFDNKWNQDLCQNKKPFICQTVTTTAEIPGTDGLDASSPPIDFYTAIIIGAIAVVIVVIVTVVLVMILKRTKNQRISHPPDEQPTILYEMSTQPNEPIENKSVKSKTNEVDEISNHYAEIGRVNYENNDECRDEPQMAILYAALEFDANKAIYEEPVISSQRKQEASAPAKVGALNGNDQPGGFAQYPTQAAEGTIYANM